MTQKAVQHRKPGTKGAASRAPGAGSQGLTTDDRARAGAVADALERAFPWEDTEQWFDYWNQVYENLRDIERGAEE